MQGSLIIQKHHHTRLHEHRQSAHKRVPLYQSAAEINNLKQQNQACLKHVFNRGGVAHSGVHSGTPNTTFAVNIQREATQTSCYTQTIHQTAIVRR